MSSLRQRREFKEAFEAFSKTDEGKKQLDSLERQLENIDWEKVYHKYFSYYDEIPPDQAIDELEDLYHNLSLENAASAFWKLEKHLAFIPIAIERQKKRKLNLGTVNTIANIGPKQKTVSCISEGKIFDLKNLLIEENKIEPIDFSDFAKCFELNDNPPKTPVYVKGGQVVMVYLLTLIKNVNERSAINGNLAETHFGINKDSYKTIKYRLNNKNTIDFNLRRRIDAILK